MNLLLHLCCGPCATAIISNLQQRGFAVTAFFYNPNIQPVSERQSRLRSLEAYTTKVYLPLQIAESSEQDFLAATKNFPFRPQRCLACYHLRLEVTARAAAERKFDYFTTTLFGSPHQDINAIKKIGEELAARYRVKFYAPSSGRKKFKGYRPLYTQSRQLAKQSHLYEQKYCGCLASRAESLKTKGKNLNLVLNFAF
jgi:predicted adenine nucleotide alpha hydrolase (AANH) superfamily ATPase